MKQEQLIEAIEQAGKLYKAKHKKPMEIFHMDFQGEETESVIIEACSKVLYKDGGFGYGEKLGKKPLMKFRIRFHVEGEEIDDRSVEEVD